MNGSVRLKSTWTTREMCWSERQRTNRRPTTAIYKGRHAWRERMQKYRASVAQLSSRFRSHDCCVIVVRHVQTGIRLMQDTNKSRQNVRMKIHRNVMLQKSRKSQRHASKFPHALILTHSWIRMRIYATWNTQRILSERTLTKSGLMHARVRVVSLDDPHSRWHNHHAYILRGPLSVWVDRRFKIEGTP